MNKLLRIRAIRAIEAAHLADQPDQSLMSRAAESATRCAMAMCEGGGRILVMAGPGNNGGDAWVVARLLQARWYNVTVLALGQPKAREAAEARNQFLAAGGTVTSDWPTSPHDLIIDGLLGIGLDPNHSRPPTPDLASCIDRANESGWPILALDVPSGLGADTGVMSGSCIRATRTITFIADKPGLHTAAGPDHAGIVEVADLGTGTAMPAKIDRADHGWLLGPGWAPIYLPVRKHNSHKGSYGSVGILGAARGMTGAGLLAARAALFAGAGKVFLAPLDETMGGVDWSHPEIMFCRPRELLDVEPLTVIVIGPGMGMNDAARNLIDTALRQSRPLVVDADALNLIARGRALQSALRKRADNGLVTVLTPHPAEAARLLGQDTAAVNADRLQAAQMLATTFGAITVLKGAGSIVASADGAWSVNATGNPGMATGGMGDVLSGILAALIGQAGTGELSPLSAVQLGVWAHGLAADRCLADGIGPAGLTASEVLLATRQVLNRR